MRLPADMVPRRDDSAMMTSSFSTHTIAPNVSQQSNWTARMQTPRVAGDCAQSSLLPTHTDDLRIAKIMLKVGGPCFHDSLLYQA